MEPDPFIILLFVTSLTVRLSNYVYYSQLVLLQCHTWTAFLILPQCDNVWQLFLAT